jgi:hypothetical protein
MANKKKEEVKEKAKEESAEISGFSKVLVSVLNGSFLTGKSVTENLPFFLFLAFLMMIYIGNGYYSEDKVREINYLGTELKELRSEYITTKSELMFKSKQSEVAKSIKNKNIKESTEPPYKLIK